VNEAATAYCRAQGQGRSAEASELVHRPSNSVLRALAKSTQGADREEKFVEGFVAGGSKGWSSSGISSQLRIIRQT